MKKVLTVLALIISAVAFAQTKQIRTVGDFESISGATGIKIELTQGNTNEVMVSTNDNRVIDNIKTVVERGVLKIYYDNKIKVGIDKGRKINVYVTYKAINKLKGSSGAVFTAKNAITSSTFSFDMTSGSYFTGEIKATTLSIDQSSGAICKVTGNATNVNADLSSGAIFTANDLSSETCTASVSTGGILKIGVTKKLTVSGSTGGIVNYKGNPEVQQSLSTGAVVSKI